MSDSVPAVYSVNYATALLVRHDCRLSFCSYFGRLNHPLHHRLYNPSYMSEWTENDEADEEDNQNMHIHHIQNDNDNDIFAATW